MPKKPAKPAARKPKTDAIPAPTPAALRAKGGKPRTGKPARYPDAQRIAEVQNLMTMRYSNNEIVRRISAPVEDGGYGVNERTVRHDIARVMAEWKEAATVGRDEKVAAARTTAAAMFRRHLARGEGKLADSYFDKLCKIDGAYAPDQMKILGAEVADAASLSDEELEAAIVAETRRLLASLPPEKRAAILLAAGQETE